MLCITNVIYGLFFRYADIPDEWEPPEPQPYKDLVSGYFSSINIRCYVGFTLIKDRFLICNHSNIIHFVVQVQM